MRGEGKRTRRRGSFAALALRVGAITPEELRRARSVQRQKGRTLQEVLVAEGLLAPALATWIAAAVSLRRRSCSRCGRTVGRSREVGCRCRRAPERTRGRRLGRRPRTSAAGDRPLDAR